MSDWNPYLAEYTACEGWDHTLVRLRQATMGAGWVPWTHEDVQREADRWMQVRAMRWLLTARYAFAVPGEEALAVIARYAPIVELGAGTGYWARCLRERGVDVVAYDIMGEDWRRWFHPQRLREEQTPENGRFYCYEEPDPANTDPECWTEVLQGGAEALDAHPDRTLLLVWPDSSGYDHQALERYQGRHLIYVGEQGGCTGSEPFRETLLEGWEEVEDAPVPQWESVHDHLSVFRRQGQP